MKSISTLHDEAQEGVCEDADDVGLCMKRWSEQKAREMDLSQIFKTHEEPPPVLYPLSDSQHSTSWSSCRGSEGQDPAKSIRSVEIISVSSRTTACGKQGLDSDTCLKTVEEEMFSSKPQRHERHKRENYKREHPGKHDGPSLIHVPNAPALLFADDIFACSRAYPTVITLANQDDACIVSEPTHLDDVSCASEVSDVTSDIFHLQFVSNGGNDEPRGHESEDETASVSSSGSTVSSASSGESSILSSESSQGSSIFSDPQQHTGDVKGSLNIAMRSLALDKRLKQRERQLRRLSTGNKQYFQYLIKREERVRTLEKERLFPIQPNGLQRAFSAPVGMIQPLSENNLFSPSNNAAPDEPCVGEQPRPEVETKACLGFGPFGLLSPQFCHNVRSSLDFLSDLLMFERFHTIPGVLSIILYCIAHTSIYNAIQAFHGYLFGSSTSEWTWLFATFIFGICLCRCSGGIFSWLNDNMYDGAKFDLHNRLRLGQLDARFLNWIRKKKSLRQSMDLLGFYLCFMAISRVVEECLMPWMCHSEGGLLNKLPSQGYEDISTYSSEMLEKATGPWRGHTLNRSDNSFAVGSLEEECLYDNMQDRLEEEDMEFLYENLSAYSFAAMFGWGTDVVPLISARAYLLYYVIWSIVSIVALIKMGVGFSVE